MKTCCLCGCAADDARATCEFCGEATWKTSAASNPPPADVEAPEAESPVEGKPRRGRK